MAPVCVFGDVTKAFLQIELYPDDRDAFGFLYRMKGGEEVHVRFGSLPFGGENSPFVLGGMFRPHLETLDGDETVKKQLMENTYVDNVMRLVSNEDQETQFRDESIRILGRGQFPLAKWESNLGRVDTKLLGINWNK